MSKDIRCPYCNVEQEICHDDGYGYEEDGLHQQECDSCDKTFTYETSISFYYEAFKADCLNDGEHTYKAVIRFPMVIFNKVCVRCSQCEDEKNVPYEEAYKYGYDQDEVNKAQKQENCGNFEPNSMDKVSTHNSGTSELSTNSLSTNKG